jgi:hypothetical protein
MRNGDHRLEEPNEQRRRKFRAHSRASSARKGDCLLTIAGCRNQPRIDGSMAQSSHVLPAPCFRLKANMPPSYLWRARLERQRNRAVRVSAVCSLKLSAAIEQCNSSRTIREETMEKTAVPWIVGCVAALACGSELDAPPTEGSRQLDLAADAPLNEASVATSPGGNASVVGEDNAVLPNSVLPDPAPIVPGPPARFVPPMPPELAEGAGIIESYPWALALGKALFWDQQVGSDGQACASCHFNAGADVRIQNQINPGFLDSTTGASGDVAFGSNRSDSGTHAPGQMPGGGSAGPNATLVAPTT